jgi:predicted HicB family RNase H-like nuclease
MKNVLKHKGCAARVEFDAEDCIFVGHVAGIKDAIGFHANTVEGLIAAFGEAVDDYLDTCARLGKAPDKPLSGKVFIRATPDLHARAAVAAKMAGKSLNQFGVEALERATEEVLAGERVTP